MKGLFCFVSIMLGGQYVESMDGTMLRHKSLVIIWAINHKGQHIILPILEICFIQFSQETSVVH